VGWAHGVLNTDNMSILGLTMDYGPYGFMERYDPTFICNHSDHQGRYSFQHQPDIGYWNIRALGQTLSLLIDEEALQMAPQLYEQAMLEKYAELMRAKLGLVERHAGDDKLVTDLLNLMDSSRTDYTTFFRALGIFSRRLLLPIQPFVISFSIVRRLMIGRSGIVSDYWPRRARMLNGRFEWIR